jgi:hypothetical protein
MPAMSLKCFPKADASPENQKTMCLGLAALGATSIEFKLSSDLFENIAAIVRTLANTEILEAGPTGGCFGRVAMR